MHQSRSSFRRDIYFTRNVSSSSLSQAAMPRESINIHQTPCSSRAVFQPYRRKSATTEIRKRPRQRGISVQNLNLEGFKPAEIEIKTKSRGVIVHAKSREESNDGTIYLAEVSRYFTLPDDVRATDIKCVLSEDGRLTLKAPVRYHAQRAIYGTSIILRLHMNERSKIKSISGDSVDGIEMANGLTGQADSQNKKEVVDSDKSEERNSERREDVSSEGTVIENDTVPPENEAVITDFKKDKILENSIQNHDHDLEGNDEKVADDQRGLDLQQTVSNKRNSNIYTSTECLSCANINVEIDIRNILPNNLRLKCKNNILFIHAEQERLDGDTYSKHELHRKIRLPENALVDQAQAKVDSISGKLKITVPVAGDRTETASQQLE